MFILTLISVTAAALLLAHLLVLRRELGRMTGQLRRYNERTTGKKLEVNLFDKRLESLAGQINRQSDLVVEAEANRRRTENELRQAISNMSHDIRTPLTSIFGYIQLLEVEPITPEEKREYLDVVKNRTKRLQALLNDFFELSLIESADHQLKTERIVMTVLLSDTLVGFYDSFNERGLTPDIRLPKEPVAVYADESAVRRVVENLLINTLKHATGQVSICFKRRETTAELRIVNEARDLSDMDVRLLFDRFYTVDRTRSGQGSGLGLSIAKSLMNKMNGTLTAELHGDNLTMICCWPLWSPGEAHPHYR
ncbi:sensor histidine kinase [Paenibacillus silagei]|uniref:histidine kinase n=1 Tax=Paenibacillus silagei TaxID=1670801 RepID=A0ABS4NLK8_9BACL|nr:histidine kinase dimerization/phospho-acceptor domain-containing protein [Paenibacillus silagei]MBP2110376.1 signal transduction histidine kinase [Paenibacillus silagei]